MARSTDPRAVRKRHTGLVAGDLQPPLVEAQLAAPRLRVGMLPRPRLARTLDAGDEAALTLVSAPPGYGKTTAVRAWCHDRQTPLAWVTLDSPDNDPVRLWTYIATAVDRVREGLGRGALQRLQVPGAAIESAVDELTNGVAAYDSGLVIVVDDAHSVTDEQCLASLNRFVRQLPSTARLVSITRTDPALRLAGLRAQGALAELRADELAFTRDEAHELLVERGGLALRPDEVELLVERTEGWPAALVLAALWLRGVSDPGTAVRDFGGGQQFVADYLSQEVLASLDGDARSFLSRASVLGRFTAELCDGVFDRGDSAAVLAELERSNLFVIRLERSGWSRIHSLIAEFARLQLAAVEPGAASAIHRRAAEWLRAAGLLLEAVEHAAAAGDQSTVAQLLSEYHLVLLRSGRARTLLGWVRELPEELLLEYPELTVSAATAAALIGEPALERRRLLQLADRAGGARPAGASVEAAAATVRAASVDDDVGAAVADGKRAVELAETDANDVLVAALGGHARALYFAGELDRAWAIAFRALEHAEAESWPPGHAFARSTLALVAVERGRLGTARAHAEKAKAIVGPIGVSRSWLAANAAAALGVVLTAQGELARAERELAYAERVFRDELATVHHAWLLLLLARVRCRRGRLDEAENALDRASEALPELADSGTVSELLEEVAYELDERKARAGAGELVARPSEAEFAVLELLATDLPVREIAQRLFLSPNTVRSHSRTIYRKLGVNSRAEAVARADVLRLLQESGMPKPERSKA